MESLDSNDINNRLACLVRGWDLVGDKKIRYQFCFRDFTESVEFVNKVAKLAESLDHHPEICIDYNKVDIGLTTHKANGLTKLDFEAASNIEKIYDEIFPENERAPE